MVIISNPSEKQLLDSMIEFFVDCGFIAEARRMGEKAFSDWKTARAERFRRAMADQAVVSKQNAEAAHRGVDGVGQVEMRVAQSFQHEVLLPIYGTDGMKDQAAMKRLVKDNPGINFKPTYERKAQIIKP